jgi:H+/Cl- antiporter ClcA
MSKTKKIVFAIFFILTGIALIWWQIYLPIVDAMNHKPEIKYEYKALVFGPVMLLFGIYMLFAPKDIDFSRGYIPGDKKQNRFVLITALLFLIIAAVTFFLFQKVIQSYGYR